jgi:hypothetical protein
MKSKMIATGLVLLAGIAVARAANINIPDGSFQFVSAVLNGPIVGQANGNLGAWSAQFNGLLNVDAQLAASNAAAVGWVTPPDGRAYELKITLPASVEANAEISQNLTNQLQPDSVYTLSVDLNPQTALDLLSGSSLNLYAVGSTNLASMGGTNLVDVFTNGSGFQTVTLTYKTPNTVPTNALGVSFGASGVASLGGSLYVDNFQLSVAPIQVQMNSFVTQGHNGAASTVTLTGQGGAAGGAYKIITSASLLTSTPVWSLVTTNQFDANGNFSQTFTVDPNTPYRFYRAEIP